MKSLCLLLLTLLPALSPAARADQARDDRWTQDLTYLSTELPKRAANLFFVMPRTQFDQAVSGLMQAIPSLSDAEVVTGMARIVAMAGDAHTAIWLTQTPPGFRALPLSLYWFQDGLYVISAASEYRQALAARVVRIGDKTVEQAYQSVSTVISHENDLWLRAETPGYLILPDLLQALKIAANGPPVRFTFEDAAHNSFSLDIDYVSAPSWVSLPDGNGFVPLALRNTGQAYWYVYLADSRTLYFKYNQCVDLAAQPFASFVSQMFAAFDANPVDRLVVDLRNNGGGSTSVLSPFITGMQARQNRFATTRAYVLFNRSTFSSAMLNVQEMKNDRDQAVAVGMPLGQVVFMGEPTGGNPTVPWRNGASFSLPNSKISVNYTTTLAPTSYQPGAAVDPDVVVPVYSYDGFARHDPVLAAVLADSKGDTPQESSAIAVVNGASFRVGAAVAPGSLASAFGDFSGADSGDAGTMPLPSRIGGTELLVNDVAAPLVAVRPAQINFQVPAAAPAGKVALRVVRGANTIASGTMYVAPAGPGLFTTDLLNPARPGAILNQDYSMNTAAKPAHTGEVVQIYATGQGATDPAVSDGAAGPVSPLARSTVEPRVYIGSAAAEVVYSGLTTEFAGLWQVNVKVPAGMSAGQYPVFAIAGTAASNGVTLWIAP
ncbi:MAG: hypothetical protein ABSH44_03015 [Bryobacteraceae bacterium]